MNLFISHSSKEAKSAKEICEILEKSGHNCFLAPRDIRSGHEYAEEIINGIDKSDMIILLLSKAANSSPHVLREIERAVSKKLPIIVYKLEEVTLSKSMEYFLMTHQWVSQKSKVSYQELLSCVDGFSEDDAVKAHTVISEDKEKSKKAFIIKASSISAAAAVLVIAAVVIFGVINKPASALNEGDIITAGTTTAQDFIETTDETTSAEDVNETSGTTGTTEATETTETTAMEGVTETAESNTDTKSADTTQPPKTTEKTMSASEVSTEPPITENEPVVEQTTNLTEVELVSAPVVAELGDTITLGEYLGEAINWRVIALEDDGKTALVIADNVLTMKCFDAAEGGEYNSYDGNDYWRTAPHNMDKEIERLVRGDNTWETSNLRTWLNSDRDNVKYIGQEPSNQAMSEKRNGYNTEGGFLKSFSKEEMEAILTSSVETNGVTTEDLVFLLASDELYLLDEADVSTYAIPTDGAVKQDQSLWFQVNVNEYNVRDHYWWLRDPNTDTASEVYIVNNSYAGDLVLSQCAGLEGYGVRPVMRIDLTAECVQIN